MPFTRIDSENAPLIERPMYMHCTKCIRDWEAGKAPGESPMTYARVNIVFNGKQLQGWCVRHDANIVTYEFVDRVDYEFGATELEVVTSYLKDAGASDEEAASSGKFLLEELELRGLEIRMKEKAP